MSGINGRGIGIGIGTDIERVQRFRGESRSVRLLLSRIFTDRERNYCETKTNPAQHFAGIFAAKEASLKAIGQLFNNNVTLTSFEILHDRKGAPYVNYLGEDGRIKKQNICVSIAHTSVEAIAVALVVTGWKRLD